MVLRDGSMGLNGQDDHNLHSLHILLDVLPNDVDGERMDVLCQRIVHRVAKHLRKDGHHSANANVDARKARLQAHSTQLQDDEAQILQICPPYHSVLFLASQRLQHLAQSQIPNNSLPFVQPAHL